MKKFAYLAVKVEGGLIPQDVLSRIGAADRELPGIRPEDYHLAASERLGDAASRRWEYLLGAYRAFRDRLAKLPAGDAATTPTRERWLQVLLGELGFGHVPYVRGGLKAGEKEFPVSHLWHSVPMHLLGWNTDLDRGIPGQAATKRAPQSMLQEFLNLSDDHLWGVLSNGRQLRILRDSTTLVGAAYVEFDLEAIFDGELYSDFVLLYTLLHASRFELISGDDSVPTCADCWLEKWRAFAAETGMKAREQMRDGVKEALIELGTGFLMANSRLRDQLQSGRLTRDDFYHELLRLAYQLIFVFVAEDRGVLLDRKASQDAKDRYTNYFSSRRLRNLAVRRSGDRHTDLWKTMTTVIRALGDDGLSVLALPGLGGLFFRTVTSSQALTYEPEPDQLLWCDLSNEKLLTAVRKMCTVRAKDGRPRDVDFQHLDTEELGSIYEALLELVPYIDAAAQRFELKGKTSGNERKTTGSYYTQGSLIESLLNFSLDPVIEDYSKSGDPNDLLKITVCDPACGSGHFLVAAARRIAKRYAAMVTGEAEPVLSAIREAMHKVVAECIYGVDLNPLATELAKVSLWIESLEPGRPLAFLDAHIKVGNALLGATPALLAKGVPDTAFNPQKVIEGDDKAIVNSLKKQNQQELTGQVGLFEEIGRRVSNRTFGNQARALMAIPVSRIADVREQERRFHEFNSSKTLLGARRTADAWCASFVWPKHAAAPSAITTATIRHLENGGSLSDAAAKELDKLVDQYRFFHWYLEFPEIFRVDESSINSDPVNGWEGGFSCIVGNPPWDTLSPDTREFFGKLVDGIRGLSKAEQNRMIEELLKEYRYQFEWSSHRRYLYSVAHFLKASGRYVMYASGNLGKGDFNVYRSFIEFALTHALPKGYVAQVVQSGLYAGANATAIRSYLLSECTWTTIFGFNNKGGRWFPDVTLENFAAYSAQVGQKPSLDHKIHAAFGLENPDILGSELASKGLSLEVEEIRIQNPETLVIPDIRDPGAAKIAKRIFDKWPSLGNRYAGLPYGDAMAEYHMGDKLGLLHEGGPGLPVYEGRMITYYDHRAKRYVAGHGNNSIWEEVRFGSQRKEVVPQWFIDKEALSKDRRERISMYRVGFMNVADPGRQRSFCSAIIPPDCICGDKVPTLAFPNFEWYTPIYLAIANSLVIDFIARQRVMSKALTFNILHSLPIARLDRDDPKSAWLANRSLRLTCTSSDMIPFWNQMASFGWVTAVNDTDIPGEVDESQREIIKAEIDAYVALCVYGLSRADFEHIIDSFVQLQGIERKKFGEFRTKRMVMQLYDAMQNALYEGKQL